MNKILFRVSFLLLCFDLNFVEITSLGLIIGSEILSALEFVWILSQLK